MAFNDSQNTPESGPKGGILDTIMETEHAHALADFNPETLVLDLISALKEREREIIQLRYGLSQNKAHTLEAIGSQMSLTRERVRQVEKESLRKLREAEISENLKNSIAIIKKAIEDHGGIFAEKALVDHVLITDQTERRVNALLFLLELFDEFLHAPESDRYYAAWHIVDFDQNRLHAFHDTVTEHLEANPNPKTLDELKAAFRETETYSQNQDYFTDKVIENLLRVSKHVESNPFGHYGLTSWRVIKPRDVGDKAYLVLKHYGKPEHYVKITERINQHKFDDRMAYKETVHNELIMDPRFVLVGRGIYALTEWGYRKGVVMDVIREILEGAGQPLSRQKIIDEVMKRRLVKRNTVLVGLSNRKHFKKVGKDLYGLT